MGRGQAEDLFYGEDMESHSLPEREGRPIDPLWEAIESVSKSLSGTRRHYPSLQPDESSNILLTDHRFFPVLDDPKADDYEECFVVGLIKDIDGNTLVSVNTYETTGLGDFIENIYLGSSPEQALETASKWAQMEGRSSDFVVGDEDFAAALEDLARKLR